MALRRAAQRRGDQARPFEPVSLMREARAEGVRVGWREVVWLLERDPRNEPWTPAEFVLDFLRWYLVDRGVDWMVDPCATTPTLLPALLDAGVAERGAGFARLPSVREVATLTADLQGRIGWHDGWHIPLVSNEGEAAPLGTPDLIVSMPPAGTRNGGRGVLTIAAEKTVGLHDDVGSLAVLNATELASGGEAIFLLPNNFLFRQQPHRVREALSELGVHVHAAIDVQRASRAIGVGFTLVFIRRELAGDVFVGQLTPEVDGKQLVRNLKRRKRGPVPALGRKVRWQDYSSFDELVARERVERLVAKASASMQPLDEVLAENVAMPPREPGAQLEASANTVYLPTYLSARAHSDAESTSGKASGYYRLVLNPGKALAEYVATMLNSELGRALRATWLGLHHPDNPAQCVADGEAPSARAQSATRGGGDAHAPAQRARAA